MVASTIIGALGFKSDRCGVIDNQSVAVTTGDSKHGIHCADGGAGLSKHHITLIIKIDPSTAINE